MPPPTTFWRQGHLQTVLDDGWKLIASARPARDWLFHLAADPLEQHDVAASHPGKVAELKSLLAAHNANQVEPLWPSVVEAPVLIRQDLRRPVRGR